jgi:hypothetical protein
MELEANVIADFVKRIAGPNETQRKHQRGFMRYEAIRKVQSIFRSPFFVLVIPFLLSYNSEILLQVSGAGY